MWALIRAALPDAMAQNGVGFTLDPKMSPFLGGISAPPLVLEFSPNGISPPLLAPSASWPRYLPALRSSGHCSDVSTHSPPRPRPCCYFLLFCAAEGTRNYIILSRLKSSRPPPGGELGGTRLSVSLWASCTQRRATQAHSRRPIKTCPVSGCLRLYSEGESGLHVLKL